MCMIPTTKLFWGVGNAKPQDSSLLLFSLTSIPGWVFSGRPRAGSYQAHIQSQEETGCSPHSASGTPLPTVLLDLQAPPRHTQQGSTPTEISKVSPTDFYRQWSSVELSYKLTTPVGQVPASGFQSFPRTSIEGSQSLERMAHFLFPVGSLHSKPLPPPGWEYTAYLQRALFTVVE